MGSITTTADVSRLRVGVELSGWAADGDVAVYRVHADGTRHEVRGMSAVSGGAAFGWDYETPLEASFTYEADDAGSTVTSSAAELASSTPTLTVPGLPTFGGEVSPTGKPALSRARPTVDIDILGRTTDISKTDVMKAASFTLELRTRSDAEAYSLSSMLAIAPVLLLRIPRTRVTDWCYVRVSGVGEVPFVRYVRNEETPLGSVAEWATWTIDCKVTDAPVGDMVGDPTSTWQALKDTGLTWQDLKDSGLTWLQVLKGEFSTI